MPRGGLERYTDGDHLGCSVSGGGNAGDAVQVTGAKEVTPTSTADADVHGVLGHDADAGEKVRVDFHGATYVNVVDGTSAGVYLTASSTEGVMREINTGGASGETAQNKSFLSLEAEQDGVALVLIQ